MLGPTPAVGRAPHAALVAVRLRIPSLERVAFPLGVGIVGVLALAACLPGARRFALWQDEVASAHVFGEPDPLAVIRHVAHTESTPPLWYALAWTVHRCGASTADVRLISVVAAVLLAAGTAVAAQRVVARPAALLAGAAVALAWQLDFHGRELRSYELAALLAVVLPPAARRGGAPLAAVVAAGSLTHYFFLLSVAAVVAWRPRLWRAVAVGLIPVALWAPLLARQYEQHRFSFIGAFSARTVTSTYWAFFARSLPHAPVLHALAPVALTAAVVVGAVLLWRTSDDGRLWAYLAVAPVAGAALLWLAGMRIYDTRNLIAVAPFAAVAVAAVVARLPRRVAVSVAGALLVLVAAGFVRSNRVPPVAYDRISAALVAEGWRSGAPIGVYGNVYAVWGPVAWYLPGRPAFAPAPPAATPRFVIASRGAQWGRVLRHAEEVRYVGQTLVARVDGTTRLRGLQILAEARR